MGLVIQEGASKNDSYNTERTNLLGEGSTGTFTTDGTDEENLGFSGIRFRRHDYTNQRQIRRGRWMSLAYLTTRLKSLPTLVGYPSK